MTKPSVTCIKESIKKSASGRKLLEILNDKVAPKAASATSDGDLAQTNSTWKEPTMPDPLPEPLLYKQ
jgi:hypothetical protein